MSGNDAYATVRAMMETDLRLGVRDWPIPPPARRAPDRARHAPRSDPVQAGRPGTPRTPPAADPSNKAESLRVLDETEVKGCTRCTLHRTRTRTVFGQGRADARLVFVGEAPGFEEDKQGLAFVGRAGQLLTRMIQAMGLTRDDVFICNVLKCRPPGNRNPAPDEIAACQPFLREQLRVIAPEVIVALGAPAAKTLLETTQSIGRLRGAFHEYRVSDDPLSTESVPLMPTYHPAYLLRNPAEKGKTWSDLQKVMTRLGLTATGSGGVR